MLDAYAQGVNAFIQTTESLPVEYGISDHQPRTLGAVGRVGGLQSAAHPDGGF